MGGRALAEVYDRSRISELFEAYARHIDALELEALAEVFTPDCRVSYGEVELEGLDALLGFLRKTMPRFAATSHHITNLQVRRPASDEARVESYIQAWHRYRAERPDLIMHGRYSSRAVRTPDGWRIAEHRGRLAETNRSASPLQDGPDLPPRDAEPAAS